MSKENESNNIAEEQQINLDETIETTKQKIADAINEAKLPLPIIKLMLENFLLQCKQ